ncbi:MAG: hypothetical protein MUF77_06365 [Leptospira sp.]|nr:hypothetical protein [Leptospira sp.]
MSLLSCLEGFLMVSFRFPLVLAFAFFSANFIYCGFSHRESKAGVFRVDDSVIRYLENIESQETQSLDSSNLNTESGLL